MSKLLVTGGSKGIGFACARQLASSGWEVQTVARGPLIEAGAWSHTQQDLTAELAEDAWREFFKPRGGKGALVQALGGTLGVRGDAAAADWRTVMELNFFLPLKIQQRLLPALRECAAATIVYLGSSSVWHGRAATPYACAKAALHRFVGTIGRELAQEGILVCGVAPAAVSGYGNSWDRCRVDKPDVWAETAARQPLGRFQTPDEIAAIVARIVEQRPMELAGTILNLDANATP